MPFAAAVIDNIKPLMLTAGDRNDWKELLNIPVDTQTLEDLYKDDYTMIALYNFQLANGLEASGLPDEDTINLLKKK